MRAAPKSHCGKAASNTATKLMTGRRHRIRSQVTDAEPLPRAGNSPPISHNVLLDEVQNQCRWGHGYHAAKETMKDKPEAALPYGVSLSKACCGKSCSPAL